MATRQTMHRLGRGAARTGVALGLAAVLGVALAPAALANGLGAGPANFVSSVTAAPPGVSAQVLAADAYLAVAAEPGVTVAVPGYDGEPYLRFDADGTVHRNTRAPATYLNADRYGTDEIFEDLEGFDEQGVSADAEPDWEQVADGGVYAWHDHRIHWMSPESPPAVAGATAATPVFDWEVPVTVDGEPGTLVGSLTWHPGGVSLGWVAALAALVAAGALGGRRWVGTGGSAAVGLAGVAALAAVALLAGEAVVVAPGTDWPSVWFALPVALVAAGAAVVVRRRGREATALAGVAAISALVVALVRAPILWRPIAPGVWPEWATRALVVVTVAAAALALLDGLRSAAAVADSPADDDDHAAAG